MYVGQISMCLKNFISRDPNGMMDEADFERHPHVVLLLDFIEKMLLEYRNKERYYDVVHLVGLIVALFENM